jgi:NAD(P)-dependent dehydrogenase (short-subunit alcohol dehydrogenase family)
MLEEPIVDLELDGKVALVTGGSKGIGRACAERLAAEGCQIAICARGQEALEAAAREFARRGTKAITISADLSEETSARRVVAEVNRHFGRLDILVNNAGAIRDGDFLDTALSVWEYDWRLKLMGYIRLAQAALPLMRPRRWGRIINIVGTAARNPTTTFIAGGIANAALINFTRALADLGAPDHILVTAVSPGPIASEESDRDDAGRPVGPLGRMGRPGDVADLVTFLASERASFITGIAITVDGGASRGVYL